MRLLHSLLCLFSSDGSLASQVWLLERHLEEEKKKRRVVEAELLIRTEQVLLLARQAAYWSNLVDASHRDYQDADLYEEE